jgi:hypothetical protein
MLLGLLLLAADLNQLMLAQEFLDGICAEDVNCRHWVPFASRPSRSPLQSTSGFIPAGPLNQRQKQTLRLLISSPLIQVA